MSSPSTLLASNMINENYIIQFGKYKSKNIVDISDLNPNYCNWLLKQPLLNKYPDIKNVDIFISNGTTENLFAQGDAFGSSITGSWVSPKKPLFIIKNRDNSQVLEKAYVEGPDCK